jgi:UDP-glucose 4-epimerase
MIVAVTGAGGFIGQHLVRSFVAAGWDARPVARRDIELGREREIFQDADVVVHAAGMTRAPSVEQLRASNVEFTSRVLDAAQDCSVRRFVFLSSLAASGPAASFSQPLTDATVNAPIEAYGQSKLDAEDVVRSATQMQSVVLRPAAVYGPGDRDFVPLFRLARRGIAIHPANRDHWISIIHVLDLA